MKTFLREWHIHGCRCSYCRRLADCGARSWGFVAPQEKVWNAWRGVYVVGGDGIWYLRWTGFWQRKPTAVRG
jgi:hypothetical protein